MSFRSSTTTARSFAASRATITALVAGALVAGCKPPPAPMPDLACPDADCDRCERSSDCNDRLDERDVCDPVTHKCVRCLMDEDCPAGRICAPGIQACVEGCSARSSCSADGSICLIDAGYCVDCLSDDNCLAPTAYCDVPHNRCVACLPANGAGRSDTCGSRQFCDLKGPEPRCLPGCTGDLDCPELPSPDGGPPDGGVAPESARRCDLAQHRCVSCLDDADCDSGQACRGQRCVPGCGDGGTCPNDTTCCGGACVSLKTDSRNCGSCDTVCESRQKTCCDGWCSNPVDDVRNCGGCAIVCAPTNGEPACKSGRCEIAACKAGFADCNGLYGDGCETNTQTHAHNCGGCNQRCSVANGEAACESGRCKVNGCLAPFEDCDKNPLNGCEVDRFNDAANCGACGTTCSGIHISAPRCLNGICVGSCDKGFADCHGGKQADGCETDITTVDNCGGCGNTCSRVNCVPSCNAGACACACAPGFDNCDGDPRTGCETELTSLLNCGSCGARCVLPHATASCTTGQCLIEHCEAGYTDCDGKAANGCETHTATDTSNCGSCNRSCSLNNGIATCGAGVCGITCNAGFWDCNHDPLDGCEIDVATDTSNCGACGSVCLAVHGVQACALGKCVPRCAGGWGDCDGIPGNGCETQTDTSNTHCGACGAVCAPPHAIASCTAGQCRISGCDAGWDDCDKIASPNGCEVNTASDLNSCGVCGSKCSSNGIVAACIAGACAGACTGSFSDCNHDKRIDGCEVDLATSAANCGACNAACSSSNVIAAVCAGGACKSTCKAGFGDCDGDLRGNGCEVALASSAAHCGICGKACSAANATMKCVNSACAIDTCALGFASCDKNDANGCELPTTSDPRNCGDCGVICSAPNADSFCASGACYFNCKVGFRDCDGNPANGCEADMNDVSSCGDCGRRCSATNVVRQCTRGLCDGACKPGFDDCNGDRQFDGCETNISSDPAHCGGCYQACAANHVLNPTCFGGKCNGICEANWSDCNNNRQSDGCEVDLSSDSNNCGACGKACLAPKVCKGGTCQ